ncbi:bacillithiol system redox-active protein YtxJ [Bacillus mangrovi]|uniref:Bacillithiol system redox-active protein YtxJ n=1 Tax=Metabacillus mangrovi TaxID=1491830 RepID=A0A7X2S8N0_9BACI|nr:bacillithiol system redox-active protein YtxJ [Metabacillus mangrovi]MTH55644.1 bacillithiol system redox-active protein YtxJ [Metabacillus mangrovi]
MKQQIKEIQEFEDLLKNEGSFYFLKHSLTCPISKEAFQQFSRFTEDENVNAYFLHVQESRELSAYIAEKLETQHESPQAFLIKNGTVLWNASHWNITKDSLSKAGK